MSQSYKGGKGDTDRTKDRGKFNENWDRIFNKKRSDSPYGYCPICGEKGVNRERRPDGNDKCETGHTYPSRHARAEAHHCFR